MKKALTLLVCGLFALLAFSACSDDSNTGYLYMSFQSRIPDTVYIRTDGGTELEVKGNVAVKEMELEAGYYTLSAPSLTDENVGIQILAGERTIVSWDGHWNVVFEQ